LKHPTTGMPNESLVLMMKHDLDVLPVEMRPILALHQLSQLWILGALGLVRSLGFF
jgi:hypothetical protein